MDSGMIIFICVLIFAAVFSTVLERWKEGHPDDRDAVWSRLPDQKDKSKGRTAQPPKNPDPSPGKERAFYQNPQYFAAAPEKRVKGRAFRIISAIVIAVIAVSLIFTAVQRTSSRPKTRAARKALTSISSQMETLFPAVQTDFERDKKYADTLGYMITGYISDGTDQYTRATVNISVSTSGVIQEVAYSCDIPDGESMKTALSGVTDDFAALHARVSVIEGKWSSEHLKDPPEISEKVMAALLSNSASSSDEDKSDDITYSDGCRMHCTELSGSYIHVSFYKKG